jgi:antitoxin ParD1/3/4
VFSPLESGYNAGKEAAMASPSGTIQVSLGPLLGSVEQRVRSGSYASADEVIRAGLLALEREEAATDQWLTRLAQEALDDPRPSIPAEEAFRQIRAQHGRPPVETQW